MNKKNLRIKILSGMICTGLVLSGVSSSFAAERSSGGVNNNLATSMDIKVPMEKEKVEQTRRSQIKSTKLRNEKLQNSLDTLVTKKVLTVEQSIVVKDAIMAQQIERKENFKKMKNMTENERIDYMKKIKSSKVNLLKALIDNGTITKGQEKEIQKVLSHYNKGKHCGHCGHCN